jgi:cytochrome b
MTIREYVEADSKTFEKALHARIEGRQSKVWDLPLRLFHWALVVAFLGAFITNKLGIAYFKYHVWCGYTVIVLVVFRIVWGFVGTRHAQFRNFFRGPSATLRYATSLLRGRAPHFMGHNPLGAWMVMLLLAVLGVQAVSGLFSNDEIFNVGPLYGYVTKETSLGLTSLHRHLFYWIAGAIVLHVLAVLAHRTFDHSDLIRAMITGRKTCPESSTPDSIFSSRTWLALLLVIAVAGILAWIVQHAPVVLDDLD